MQPKEKLYSSKYFSLSSFKFILLVFVQVIKSVYCSGFDFFTVVVPKVGWHMITVTFVHIKCFLNQQIPSGWSCFTSFATTFRFCVLTASFSFCRINKLFYTQQDHWNWVVKVSWRVALLVLCTCLFSKWPQTRWFWLFLYLQLPAAGSSRENRLVFEPKCSVTGWFSQETVLCVAVLVWAQRKSPFIETQPSFVWYLTIITRAVASSLDAQL